jgi:hypothetical protein
MCLNYINPVQYSRLQNKYVVHWYGENNELREHLNRLQSRVRNFLALCKQRKL